MQIALLGPLEVRTGSGLPVEVGGARLRTLLILLALDAGRVATTQRLIDGVWASSPPNGAANALQALVSRLRRAVPGLPLHSHPAGYRLALASDQVDTVRFERLVAAGQAALPRDPATAAALLREALGLWRGPALADVAGADFARAPAARWNELRRGATEDRIEAELRLGDGVHADLLAELEELTAEYPLRERMASLLVRALYAAGRPADALAAYERVRVTLAERLGMDPSPDLAALHVAFLRGDPDPGVRTAAAGRTVPTAQGADARAADSTHQPEDDSTLPPRTNLRAALTSFVGRDEDVFRVGKLLGEARLTTLTGPGGAGKTRLATESARTLLDQVPDGVWLVELAPVTDPGGGELAQALLTALGLREQALLTTPAAARSRPARSVRPGKSVRPSRTSRPNRWTGCSPPSPTSTCCWYWTTVSTSSTPPPHSSTGCWASARGCACWRPAASRWASPARTCGRSGRWPCRPRTRHPPRSAPTRRCGCSLTGPPRYGRASPSTSRP